MARHYLNNEIQKFIKVGVASVALGSSVGILGLIVSMLFGGRLLGLLYGERYMIYKDCFVIIMLASTLWYAAGMAGCMLNAMRKFGHQLIVNLLSLAASAVAIIGVGDKYGINGMAWALVAGMGVRLLMAVAVVIMRLREGAN